MTTTYPKLASVTVSLNDGTNYSTSFNPQCSDSDIQEYFVGQLINVGNAEHDLMKQCVKIEIDRS